MIRLIIFLDYVALLLLAVSSWRFKRSTEVLLEINDQIIRHLSGRVAELTQDDDERRRATELFRYGTKALLTRRK